ncbi:hypothetical protein KKC44_03625 [Patescibacteria group bacterium]|nr:hypothetical protein [Patescibacteria group bacterium]MBU2259674.1 hypothetical protein [Patescibacteria group bacterium]
MSEPETPKAEQDPRQLLADINPNSEIKNVDQMSKALGCKLEHPIIGSLDELLGLLATAKCGRAFLKNERWCTVVWVDQDNQVYSTGSHLEFFGDRFPEIAEIIYVDDNLLNPGSPKEVIDESEEKVRSRIEGVTEIHLL